MASKDETSLLSEEALESQESQQDHANTKAVRKYKVVALAGVLGVFAMLLVQWWSHASVARVTVNTAETIRANWEWTKYKKTQMLGFSIYTFPENFQSNPDDVYYAGSFDLRADIAGRIAIMKDAVDTALDSADPDPSVLKVFIAPEFFFRGPQGAYDAISIYGCPNGTEADCYAPINEIGAQLEEIVKDVKFSDWLFIFGTVVAAQPDPNGPKKNRRLVELTSPDAALFWNFAPVYKGGNLEHKWLVTKSYVSSIDFINRTREGLGWLNVDNPNPDLPKDVYYTHTPPEAAEWLKSVNYEVVEGNHSTISFDGLLVGIEICLDHSMGVLRDTTVGQQVDLQLITSAGMSITQQSVVAPIVFLQDGGALSKTSFTTNASRGGGPWQTWTLGKSDNGVVFTDNKTINDTFGTFFALEDDSNGELPKVITTPEFGFWWKSPA